MQPRAVQGMLDFDFICKRTTPSVAGIIYTFGGQFVSKMYWGTSETLLPVYQDVEKAMAKHPDVEPSSTSPPPAPSTAPPWS
jgi:CoA binding domain.